MGIDDSAGQRIRFDEAGTEAGEEAIEPLMRDGACSHMSDHIIESYEDRDLDEHHQTSFESSLTISLENFHSLFGKPLGIILIFFLDLIELRLKRSHAFLHIVSCKRLFDHQRSDSDREQDDGYTEIASEYSEKYSQDIEYRTVQDLSEQHSQHNTNLLYKIWR